MKNKFVIFSVFCSIALALDQLTKVLARAYLIPLGDHGKSVIPGFFDLCYTGNTAAAFSIGRGWKWFPYVLFPLMFLCLGMIGYWLYKLPKNAKWNAMKLGLVAGGALGNIFDRVAFGKVTDFIVWKITTKTGSHEWPAFNLADAFLVVGLILILLNWPRDRLQETAGPSVQQG